MNALLRISAWLLALALVALPVVAVLNGWVGAERWPLSRLRVTGQFERVHHQLRRHQWAELVRPFVDVHGGVDAAGLLGVDLLFAGQLPVVARHRCVGEEPERIKMAAPQWC